VRWIFSSGFVLAVIALVVFSAIYGLDRQDRFEVTIISIDWLVLIINGVLLSMVFKKLLGVESK
jgi:predicted Co/Zn/Cd cation transporter (cation efflux family)